MHLTAPSLLLYIVRAPPALLIITTGMLLVRDAHMQMALLSAENLLLEYKIAQPLISIIAMIAQLLTTTGAVILKLAL
jgi:hypothetical protein